MVHFLAADASSYITGQVWSVNGGLDMCGPLAQPGVDKDPGQTELGALRYDRSGLGFGVGQPTCRGVCFGEQQLRAQGCPRPQVAVNSRDQFFSPLTGLGSIV